MKAPVIRAVFFDLVGTLIHPRGSIGRQYAAIAARHGAEADPAALDKAFGRAIARAPAVAVSQDSIAATAAAEREWWRRLVAGILADCGITQLSVPSRFQPYFDDLYHHFTTAAAWALYDDVLPALEGLHEAGVLTGLVSNYDTRVYGLTDALGLTTLLDSVTIPATAGAAKPDARIFEHALAQHGLAPGEAAHVGDSMEDDYLGAERAGLLPVLLDRDNLQAVQAGARRASGLPEALLEVIS